MPASRFLRLLAFSLATGAPLAAQIDYATPGRLYLQDFNHRELRSAASFAWDDNHTFPGWFAAYCQGAPAVFTPPPVVLVTEGRGQTHIGFYLYHGALSPHDGALGSQATDEKTPGVGTGGVCYGLALANRTGQVLTRFTLSYRVELWRLAANPAPQATLVASYRVGGASLGEGEWTAIPGSAYATPAPAAGVQPGNLDGNAPENVVSFGELDVTGLRIPPGETLWIRWFDVNNRQTDHGIGLDDVALSLAP